jgi:hypothetical protein
LLGFILVCAFDYDVERLLGVVDIDLVEAEFNLLEIWGCRWTQDVLPELDLKV